MTVVAEESVGADHSTLTVQGFSESYVITGFFGAGGALAAIISIGSDISP